MKQGGWTPLMWVAFGGHVKTVTALLAKGADVEARGEVVTLAENHVCPAVSAYTGSPLCRQSLWQEGHS